MLGKLKPFIPSGPDFAKSREFFSDLDFRIDWGVPGLAQLSLGDSVFLLVRAKKPTVFPCRQCEVHLIDPAGVCWHSPDAPGGSAHRPAALTIYAICS